MTVEQVSAERTVDRKRRRLQHTQLRAVAGYDDDGLDGARTAPQRCGGEADPVAVTQRGRRLQLARRRGSFRRLVPGCQTHLDAELRPGFRRDLPTHPGTVLRD